MVSSAKSLTVELFWIVREVINVDKEEERAENTSLGDSWGDVDGGRYIALQEDLLCAVS